MPLDGQVRGVASREQVRMMTSTLLSRRPDDVLATNSHAARPGAGAGFVLRRALIYGFGMIGANTLGALVTFLYAGIVIPPLPGHGNDNAQTRLSLWSS